MRRRRRKTLACQETRARNAAFTPLQRTHGLGRKNDTGRRPVRRRKRRAPYAQPRNARAPVSEGRIWTPPPERGCVADQPQQPRRRGTAGKLPTPGQGNLLRLVLRTQPRSGTANSRGSVQVRPFRRSG